jgi:hypothetical protein
VASTPDQAAELNLANDQIPHHAVPSPRAVVGQTRQIERQRFTFIVRVLNLLHLRGVLDERGARTSWLGPFLGIATLSLVAALLGGKFLLSANASDALRIWTAAGFGGAILVPGLVFLVYRSRQKQ